MTDLGPRPYARLKDSPPSVTGIIDVLDKPGLAWGATKEAAQYAVLSQDEWMAMDPKDAIERIRRHHDGVWKNRAAMGTLIHSANEKWCLGQSVSVKELVAANPNWEHQVKAKVEEATGYVDGLEKFWLDWKPRDITTEEIVRIPGRYIGTRDMLCTLADGRRWLLDAKSTAEQRAEKGIYGDSWSLQLAAYNYATEIVTYKRGTKGRPEVATVEPNKSAEACGIIHLRGDGNYQLFEVDAGPQVFAAFNQLVDLYRWRRNCPIPTPIRRDAHVG